MFIIMPRPKKCRMIGETPQTVYFKPRGVPINELEIVELSLDENARKKITEAIIHGKAIKLNEKFCSGGDKLCHGDAPL